jgi:hypothetical protein
MGSDQGSDNEGSDGEEGEEFELEDIFMSHKDGDPNDKISRCCGTGGRDYNMRNQFGLTNDSVWCNDIVMQFA